MSTIVSVRPPCAELHPRHVALPRGCLDEVTELARRHGIELAVEDRRKLGQPLPAALTFRGELLPPQQRAFADLMLHDHGVLAATTAFGKTVVRRQRREFVAVVRSKRPRPHSRSIRSDRRSGKSGGAIVRFESGSNGRLW